MNTSPNSQWYYALDGQQHGPLSFAELQQNAKTLPDGGEGVIAWTEGMSDWLPIKEIPGLTGQYEGQLTEQSSQLPGAPPSGVPSHIPQTNLIPQALQDGLEIPPEPIPLNIGFCIQQAWKHTLKNFGMIIAVGFISLIINGMGGAMLNQVVVIIDGGDTAKALEEKIEKMAENGSGSPQEIMQYAMVETMKASATPAGILAGLLKQALATFLALGVAAFGFKLLNGESPQVEVLFSQRKKFLRGFLGTLLYGLIVGVGLLLFVIPGIYFGSRFAFFLEAIVEKDLGVIDSFRYSYGLTNQNVFPIIGLALMNLLIVIAGVAACFVGLLWAIPVVTISRLVAYRYLHAAHQGLVVRD